MKAFAYGVWLQWKIDFRKKDVLMMYYIMPLAFFLFMGGIFSSIDPDMKETLAYAMTVFAVCAGAFVGVPTSIVGFFGTDMRKAYRIGGVPPWTAAANGFVSACAHLLVVSCVIAALSPITFGAEPVAEALPFLGVALCFMAAAVSIGVFLGLLFKSQAKLSVVTMMLFLVSIMLSGIMLPDQFLPEAMRTIGGLLPSRWAFNAFSGENVVQNVLLMVGLFGVFALASALRIKAIGRTE